MPWQSGRVTRTPTPLSLALSNALQMDADGWALVAGYGDHPKTRTVTIDGLPTEERFLQSFDASAADDLLASLPTKRLRRAHVGLSVYAEHPDDPTTADAVRPGEKPPTIGIANAFRKTERGLEAHLTLTADGASAATRGSQFPSVYWDTLPTGETRDGMKVMRPYKLLSVGLTPHPNISGVESLANAATPGSPSAPTMKPLLTGWLAARGVTLAPDATDATALAALETLYTGTANQAVALGNSKSTLETQVTALTAEKTTLTADLAAAQTALSNSAAATAAERLGRSEALVDLAIAQGRLAVAERGAQITALANSTDFPAATTALSQRAIAHATTGAGMGERKALANAATPHDRIARQTAAVATLKARDGCTFEMAFNRARIETPALFA